MGENFGLTNTGDNKKDSDITKIATNKKVKGVTFEDFQNKSDSRF